MPSFHQFLFCLFILRAAFAATGHLLFPANFQNDFVAPNLPAIIRRVRQVTAATDSDYSWKASKTPTFITTQMKKQQAEPILTVFSSEGAFRNGKSREIFLPEYNVGKRIIYRTTLPDAPHSPTRPPYNAYGEFVGPLRSDQRSYDANKVGHDFVTRVQSSIINVAGKDKTNTDNRKSNPSFVILENPSPNHYQLDGMNKFAQRPDDYHNKHMTGITYHQHQSPYHGHHKPYISDFKLPYSSSLPYYNVENDLGVPRYQYQYQSSPYYEEIEKIHAPGHDLHQHYQNYASNSPLLSPPYPSRHVRFPTNRYPQNFPFNDLLSPSKPHTELLNKNPLDSSFLQHPSNLGLGDSLSTNPSGFDFNNNLGPVTMDHNSAFDDNRFSNTPLSLKNKFPNFNKYSPGTSSNFNSEFPFNSQFSDKPFDWGEFSSAAAAINDGVTRDKDYHIKGSSSLGETQNGFGSAGNNTTESGGTFKPTTSPSDTSTDETQTESDYEAELD